MDDQCHCGLIPKEHPSCPQCGEFDAVIPILYGLPNMDALQLESEKKLEMGSRFYKPGLPCWRCKNCDFAFGRA